MVASQQVDILHGNININLFPRILAPYLRCQTFCFLCIFLMFLQLLSGYTPLKYYILPPLRSYHVVRESASHSRRSKDGTKMSMCAFSRRLGTTMRHVVSGPRNELGKSHWMQGAIIESRSLLPTICTGKRLMNFGRSSTLGEIASCTYYRVV